MPKKQVMVVSFYHCDVVWRRTPEAQTAIRDRQYTDALNALAKYPEFRFEFDQAALVREYLDNHPERLEELRQLIAAGRVDITGGEEAIPDTNMPAGEALVRNILHGRLWFAETLGAVPTLANMDDAFGLNAQLPQIFKQFGYQWFRDARTPGLDPAVGRGGIRWEGVDGSQIFYLPGHASVTRRTHICNLPVAYTPEERPRVALGLATEVDQPVVYCQYGAEEDPVEEEIIEMILGYTPPAGTTVRFALAREALAEMQRLRPDAPVVKGEFNPSQPGTHITRIGLKQAYRRAEWATFGAESAAACASLRGAAYPDEVLVEQWRKLSYVQFHDALCGCHADSVNARVMGYCADVVKATGKIATRALRTLNAPGGAVAGVSLFNPLPFARREPLSLALPEGLSLADAAGQPLPAERHGKETLVMPELGALGVTRWPLVKAKVAAPKLKAGAKAAGKELQVGPYSVTPTDAGIKLVRSDWNRTLVEGCLPEVRFRHESGTMWDEEIIGPILTEEVGTRRLVAVEQGPLSTRLVWAGEIRGDQDCDPEPPHWASYRDGKRIIFPELIRLQWEKELVFYPDLERIDATVRLDFAGENTEVLIGFPLQIDLHSSKALYEIPFASVERRPYYEVPYGSPELEGAPLHLAALHGKGAWPAQNWVAYGDKDWGMLLANQGTPSHRLMSGVIEVGVLRSPTLMSSNYRVPPLAKDNGKHEYHFALQPFQRSVFNDEVYRLGARHNAPPLVSQAKLDPAAPRSSECLSLEAPGVSCAAFKRAERSHSYILRTFETAGKKASGKVVTGFPVAKAYEADLMEQPGAEVNLSRLKWRPYEIKTLLLEVPER
ncbi:MAG TPA: glycosyl hydrolase-related protein [Armatimonadota bacterium]|jgi:alpha-mannosidase